MWKKKKRRIEDIFFSLFVECRYTTHTHGIINGTREKKKKEEEDEERILLLFLLSQLSLLVISREDGQPHDSLAYSAFPFFFFLRFVFFSIVDLRRVRIGTTNTHTIYCVVLSVPFYRYKFKGKERLFKRRTGRRRKNTRTTETMIRVRGLFVSFVDDQMSNIAVVIITKRNDTPYKLAKVSIWISIG